MELHIKLLSSVFDMILVTLGGTLGENFSTVGRLLEELEGKVPNNVNKSKRLLRLDLCPLDTLSNHMPIDFILWGTLQNLSEKNLCQISWR